MRSIARRPSQEEYLPLKHTWVYGADRHAGLRAFLARRGLDLPCGVSTDPPTEQTLAGLGSAKRAKFREIVSSAAVAPCNDTVNLLKDLAEEGIQVHAYRIGSMQVFLLPGRSLRTPTGLFSVA